VARGSGTGLSGGALPLADGILLSLAKFNQIVEVDPLARTARVQPGVTNLKISQHVAPLGLYYAPDPSSQIACSIGGNVAENSGGVHCLKYGLTVHNILRVRAMTIEGDLLDLGSGRARLRRLRSPRAHHRLRGLLAIILEVTVKLLPKPEAAQVIMASFGRRRERGPGGRERDRRGHRAGGPRDDGQARDERGRGLRPRGLRPKAEAILLVESDGAARESPTRSHA
jgi:glycolate oxidase